MDIKTPVPSERVVNKILFIRGKKVMIDADLAELYGVETKVLNQAVKRNLKRFPQDFMFQLNAEEVKNLKVASSRSQIVTLKRGGNIKYLPYAFTEHGVAMLSSVLKSQHAVQVNIFIIRSFIKLRELLASNTDLAHKIEELEHDQKRQNQHINSIYAIINKLLSEPVITKSRIGFDR